MNHYLALRSLTGLSIAGAATWLQVKEDTSKQWSSGRREPPDDVIDRLVDLAEAQDFWARRLVEDLSRVVDDVLMLDVPADDAQASRYYGMPTVSAWAALAGRVIVVSKIPVDFRPLVPEECDR